MYAEVKGEEIAYYNDGGAAFRFVADAATEVCSNAFADGSNMFQGGILATLLRTARGRYVWAIESHWVGQKRLRFEAVERPGGLHRLDIARVDDFIGRHGDDLDLINWRDDIGVPLEELS